MTRHYYGIFSFLPQTAFCGETCGRVSNSWLFSQAKFVTYLPPHLGQHSLCTLLDGYFFNDVMALKCVIFMKVEMILVVE